MRSVSQNDTLRFFLCNVTFKNCHYEKAAI